MGADGHEDFGKWLHTISVALTDKNINSIQALESMYTHHFALMFNMNSFE